MYTKWYGFTEQPFNVTPNSKFLFLSKTHREVLATLIYCVEHKKGFVLITGEVGTGKTTIINSFIERANAKNKIIVINAARLSFDAILRKILKDCHISNSGEKISKLEAIERLKEYALSKYKNDGNVTIVIDEAQNLSLETIESLRLLSNIETQKDKLLQIILCGQPELNNILNKYELRQFVQRISMRRVLVPLNEKETYEYIIHHLRIVGHKENDIFDKYSLQKIWQYSQGIPRKINILCDNALLIAYALSKQKVTKKIINEAIQDLQGNNQNIKKEIIINNNQEKHIYKWKKKIGYALVMAMVVMLLAYIYYNGEIKNKYIEIVENKIGIDSIKSDRLNRKSDDEIKMQNNDNKQSDRNTKIHEDDIDKNKYRLIKSSEYNKFTYDKEYESINSEFEMEKKNKNIIIKVKKGDTLYEIINEKYNVKDKDEYRKILHNVLKSNKKIVDPDKIEVNQIIELPK